MRYVALLVGLGFIAMALGLWRYWRVDGVACFLIGLMGYTFW